MNINKETLEKIAHLARLSFEPEAQDRMKEDMNAILSFVESLKAVDTDDIKPLQSMSFEINNLRKDIVQNDLSRDQALKYAPQTDGSFFLVPKVIE